MFDTLTCTCFTSLQEESISWLFGGLSAPCPIIPCQFMVQLNAESTLQTVT